MIMMNNDKMVYSEYENRMIRTGFVRKYSIGDEVRIGTEHFTWCEDDLMYWSDDVDGSGYEEYECVPYIRHNGLRVDFIWDQA